MKKCSKCKVKKLLTEFSNDSSRGDGYSYQCKLCAKTSSKKYYELDKESHKQRGYKWKENNLSKWESYITQWRGENKEYIKEYSKNHYTQNKEQYVEYYQENKESISVNRKEYYQNNKEKVYSLNRKRYYKYPWEFRWRSMLKRTLEHINSPKQTSTYKLLGYSALELKEHLENKGMDWGKHQVEHKIPISWFKKDTPPHIVNDLRNLEPLTEYENKSKGNRFCSPVESSYIEVVIKHIKEKHMKKLLA